MAGQQRGIQTVDLSGEILRLICGSPKSLSLSEIAEALGVAINLNAGAAVIYSARTLDAVGQARG